MADAGIVCAELGVDHPSVIRHEIRSLGLFADICALSRRRPDVDVDEGGSRTQRPGPPAGLPALTGAGAGGAARRFLRGCGARWRTTTSASRAGAQRADEGAPRVWIEHPSWKRRWSGCTRPIERLGRHAPAVAAILDRRLEHVGTADIQQRRRTFVQMLDRLVAAAETRYDAVADLAREVRYAFFDKPLLEEARRAV